MLDATNTKKMSTSTVFLGPDHHLTPETVYRIAHNPDVKIKLSEQAKKRIKKSREAVEEMVEKKRVVYGVTTGFGNFKSIAIEDKDVENLQRNLMRSHSTGVGELYSPEIVRASLVVRLNSLVQGYSGVRLELLQLVTDIINSNIIPAVPCQGSVGASGDLAPLSHMGLVLMGEGEVLTSDGKIISGAAALKKAGLKPITFKAKEGLAWNNGTSVMSGVGCIAIVKAQRLMELADMSCALTVEALCGMSDPFLEEVHKLRPHPGQILSASNIRNYTEGSGLVDSMRQRVQDSYSVRCAPQVHGATRDTISYCQGVIEREINSVTDNPLIFTDPPRAVSAGHFHGQPLAIAFDSLGIAVAELADISERRIAKLVDPATNEGLPAFLISPEHAGLHSGLMISQYTAAALVSENKVLAHPASVDSIPTSANQEDHVSMGSISTRKALKILDNTEHVIVIEFLTNTQAISFRDASRLGKGTKKFYEYVRKSLPVVKEDRQLSQDINSLKVSLQAQNII